MMDFYSKVKVQLKLVSKKIMIAKFVISLE